MTCPYLWGTYLRSCSMSGDLYVPDVQMQRSYCAAGPENRFSCCPVYRQSLPIVNTVSRPPESFGARRART